MKYRFIWCFRCWISLFCFLIWKRRKDTKYLDCVFSQIEIHMCMRFFYSGTFYLQFYITHYCIYSSSLLHSLSSLYHRNHSTIKLIQVFPFWLHLSYLQLKYCNFSNIIHPSKYHWTLTNSNYEQHSPVWIHHALLYWLPSHTQSLIKIIKNSFIFLFCKLFFRILYHILLVRHNFFLRQW